MRVAPATVWLLVLLAWGCSTERRDSGGGGCRSGGPDGHGDADCTRQLGYPGGLDLERLNPAPR